MNRVKRKIRVLVVDDSMLFRELLTRGLMTDPEIEVVGQAQDPYEARDLIERFLPDVMTCDVEMPRMNGVDFIRRLLPQHAMPIIVVSTVSSAILDALSAGAIDFVTKPNMSALGEVERFIIDMILKVKAASRSKPIQKRDPSFAPSVSMKGTYGRDGDVIVIGASTGGTEAISQLLSMLPNQLPGIAIVQHIPPAFSRMFAERLNANTAFHVKEAATGDKLVRGTVIVAPGDQHISLIRSGDSYVLKCSNENKVSGHRPSVDVLFESAAKQAGSNAIGILLTGMGYDGARGLLAIRRKGGRTIGQDEETSVVYGMPKVGYEVGAVEYQLPLHRIAEKLCSLLLVPN